MSEKITLFHTNDLHSHFENWPKMRRFLQTKKAKLLAENHSVFTFDLGDAMDRVHPLSEASDGKFNVKLLNSIGYDGVTIGNNEGIGNSHQQLNELYTDANFPVILSNFQDLKTKQRPVWCQESEIIVTPQGTKLGIIAATAPFEATYAMNDWYAQPIMEFLPSLLAKLKPKVDVIILLSHLGIDFDRQIAQNYPEISVILGAHTHHLLPKGEKVRSTLICAAGKWGQYIGQVDLTIQNHHLVTSQATVFETAKMASGVGDQTEILEYQKLGEQLLKKQVIANLPHAYPGAINQDSPLMQALLAALKQTLGTKAAILNGGLLLGNLAAGPITKYELHQLLPHSMRAITVKLDGANLWRLIQEMERNRLRLRRNIVKGNGFRGKIFGDLVYAGISYDPSTKKVYWQGELLDFNKIYVIGTVDNYIYGPYFPTIEIAGEVTYLGDRFLRDILGDYFAQLYGV